MKIAIIGGAGVRTPLILQDIVLKQKALGITELSLMDINGPRLELISAVNQAVLHSTPPSFHISHTTDLGLALEGADFVITTFRVGGMEARVMDERIPLKYGILGQETTGPGGFAMALRSIPVIFNIVDEMRRRCPLAWLVNFANPSGMLAQAVFSGAGWPRVVGICDAPSSMQAIAAALIQKSPEQVYLDYFGLNHLGWVRSVRTGGQDYLPHLMEMLTKMGTMPGQPFDSDFLSGLGMIPNEYLYYYYYSKQAVNNILKKGKTRGEQLVEDNQKLFADLQVKCNEEDPAGMLDVYQQYMVKRSSTYMSAETGGHSQVPPQLEAALDAMISSAGGYAGVALGLIESLYGGKPRVMTLNIPNHGAVEGMAEDDVVEIPTLVSPAGLQPLAVGKIPDACLGLMKLIKSYERLTINAVLENSYAKAAEALTIHPLVGDYHLARTILDEFIQGFGNLFPPLK